MARSYRHMPFVPWAGSRRGSEAGDKKTWHARRRMLERVQDARLPLDERYPVSKHDAINNFDMKKDGHCYMGRCKVGAGEWWESWRDYYRCMGK